MYRFVSFAIFWGLMFVASARSQSPPASFAYVLQADSLTKTKAEAVPRLAACGRDWVVLDAVFGGDSRWEVSDLAAIRRGRKGRKVIAYISIGEAEEYRPYWRREWGTGGHLTAAAPLWLGGENGAWKGNYRVKYWNPQWQKRILAAVEDALSRGFDGVYLDIVDGFETFEQKGREFIANRINPETKQTYRRDMVDWVKAIALCARRRKASAIVIPQNGSQLLAHDDFREAVSAIGIEDLFTDGNKLQRGRHTKEVLGHLKRMAADHKPVLLVEYPQWADRRARTKKLARANGLIWLVTDRQLKSLGESGQ